MTGRLYLPSKARESFSPPSQIQKLNFYPPPTLPQPTAREDLVPARLQPQQRPVRCARSPGLLGYTQDGRSRASMRPQDTLSVEGSQGDVGHLWNSSLTQPKETF